MINDPRTKGALTELIVKQKFIENNFNVYEPCLASDEIDCIVEKNKKYFRIQCKTARYEKLYNSYRVSILGANYRVYAADAFDYLAAYLPDKEYLYLIPKNKLKGKTLNIVVDREFSKYDKDKYTRTFFVKDYLNNFNLV